MLRDAINEVRHHPGRFVATIIAIAISIGFMVASSVFLTTEKEGLAKALNRQIAGSDVLVQLQTFNDAPPKATQVVGKIKSNAGVEAAEPLFQTSMPIEAHDKIYYIATVGTPGEQFRWAKITEGSYPNSRTEIALGAPVAEKLGVKVGDTVKANGQVELKVSGLTDDPKSIFMEIGYVHPDFFAMPGQETPAQMYNVKAKPGTDLNALTEQLRASLGGTFKVDTTESFEKEALADLTSGVDQMKYFMLIFVGIALVVGMIIIANTFTILITQRRRQIGLLRAVGASTDQVRERFLAEALVLGVIGSLLGILLGIGVAAAGSAWTGSLYWGLGLPWRDLAIAVVVGVVITVIAAIAPVWKTSKVKPLEALQPVLNADAQKKVSRIRAIICGGLAGLGLLFALLSIFGSSKWLLFAVLSAAFFTFAVLGAAPLYVAWLIRMFGKVIGWGPTSRLATMNAARNPGRAAATAVALMLAVGLIVTLQVGAATVKNSVLVMLEERYPIDLVVGSYKPEGLSNEQLNQIGQFKNVKSSVKVTGGLAGDPNTGEEMVVALPANAKEISDTLPDSLADDVALVGVDFRQGSTTIEVTGTDGKPVTLKLERSAAANEMPLIVSEATMKKLVAKPVTAQVWIKLVDRGEFAATMQKIATMIQADPQLTLSGGALPAFMISTLVNVMLGIATALLGVAVAISLVGVANTLALSVIERTRESGLLRALGMKRSKLRLMLLIEAVTLGLVGVLVGVIAGAFFAWMGIRALFKQFDIPSDEMHFAIDWKLTLGMIAVAVGASAIASILPGRKAALAAPTEALAVE